MPNTIKLSVWIGVGGCRWPSSMSMRCIGAACFALRKRAPGSFSTYCPVWLVYVICLMSSTLMLISLVCCGVSFVDLPPWQFCHMWPFCVSSDSGNILLPLLLWAWVMLHRILYWLHWAMLLLLGIQLLHGDTVCLVLVAHTHCSPFGGGCYSSMVLSLVVWYYLLCFVQARLIPATVLFLGPSTLRD